MLSRRALLQRIPFAPVAAAGVVTQGPALLAKLAQPANNLPPLIMREQTVEERIAQFASQTLPWLEEFRPNLPMTLSSDVISINSFRAIAQWEMFADRVASNARSYQIPLEKAFELAKIPASWLP